MKNRRKQIVALGLLLAIVVSGCSKEAAEESTPEAVAESLHAKVNTVELTEGKYSEKKLDATWNEAEAVEIQLDGSSGTASDDSVTVEGSTTTITKEGTYVLSGTLEEGQVIVDVPDNGTVKGEVKLVFNGVSLASTSTSPFYVKSGNTIVVLQEGTENTVTDGEVYVYETEGVDEPKAAIYAKDDLTFNGTGTLTVNGNYNNGIQCKDDLKFVTGTYQITAVNHGVVGKDSVSVKNGNYTIDAGGDGVKATNYEETDKGYIIMEDGSFQITAGMDGIQAETLLRVNGGDFDITTGGGSQEATQKNEMPGEGGMGGGRGDMQKGEASQPPTGEAPQPPNGEETTDDTTESESTKGLKAYVDLVVAGGTFTIDACDDGVHSNQNVTLEGGVLTLQAGDDGIHGDETLLINGGTVDIQNSYEGLEAMDIEISGGDIKLVASDDGINAAGDDDSAAAPEEAETQTENRMQGRGQMPGGGMAGEDQGGIFKMTGGTLYVDAEGDGLDANGDIFISGGTVNVQGPVNGGNGSLDFASTCEITGGTFMAVGSSAMAQNPSDTSSQAVIVQNGNQNIEAGTEIKVTDTGGNEVLRVTADKTAQWYALSSPNFVEGQSYTIWVGEAKTEVTIQNIITYVE